MKMVNVQCLNVKRLQENSPMTNTQLKQKYVEAVRRLHICSPASKKDLKALMNYYYSMMVERGIA